MGYAEFKAFLASFLWRDGDTVLLAALDALIRMAEAGLQRELKVQDAQQLAELTFTDSSTPLLLPADYRSPDRILGLGGDYEYVTPGQFWSSTQVGSSPAELGTFTVVGRNLYISGWPSVTSPQAFELLYYRTIEPYQTADASWVADLHLDLFVYATLKHAGRFVRDDDRVPGWNEAYMEALGAALAEDTINRYARGAPQKITYGGRRG